MIWVIIANTNTCRIFDYAKNHATLSLLKQIEHPELRLKTSDTLTSDRPGHFQANDSARGAYSPHTEPKEAAIDKFSREIAEALNSARNANSYDKLILIMTPHMQGLLQHHLNKNVKERVINKIQKDIVHLSTQELVDFLKTHAQYPTES